MASDFNDDNISVELTDPNELHCFKLTFHIRAEPDSAERVPLELCLHTRQAFDLFHKLGEKIMDYFADRSAYLLKKIAGG